jgi:IS605 OrfB family transposase
MVCVRPYPRVILKTGSLSGSARAIVERLLANSEQELNGYRQRCLEVKQDERSGRWSLFITYDFPAAPAPSLDPQILVGVDLGVSCPAYVAISNGHARLGRKQFGPLAARIRSLQNQIMARRRNMLRGGSTMLALVTARSGHGRKRKLQPIAKLEGRINHAYTTLNHQLSAAIVEFARTHGAGTIQIEDLGGMGQQLSGTFLGERWRYHQLQEFLAYKAKEAGITIRAINPRYTSRRCSNCGHIQAGFDRGFRDQNRSNGFVARFQCPKCEFQADPDYNAARNLATLDIETRIKEQCLAQGLEYTDL